MVVGLYPKGDQQQRLPELVSDEAYGNRRPYHGHGE